MKDVMNNVFMITQWRIMTCNTENAKKKKNQRL